MLVSIIEKESRKVIASYPVVVEGPKHEITDADYWAEAWRCAVKDGEVQAGQKHKYRFQNQIE